MAKKRKYTTKVTTTAKKKAPKSGKKFFLYDLDNHDSCCGKTYPSYAAALAEAKEHFETMESDSGTSPKDHPGYLICSVEGKVEAEAIDVKVVEKTKFAAAGNYISDL